MKRSVHCQLKTFIQPFERQLAMRELGALADATPSPYGGPGSYVVDTLTSARYLRDNVTYWDRVDAVRTIQSEREASVGRTRNDYRTILASGADQLPEVNRRCLRYGPHGMHEYRGKFFPQLVRSLINIAKVPRAGVIADPMCGSGTTLVEAVLAGRRAMGLDLNPLSVCLTSTKCESLYINPEQIVEQAEAVARKLERGRGAAPRHFKALPIEDQEYVRAWFAESVLADLDCIVNVIDSLTAGPIQQVLRIALSNILRRVSWQKEDDLRIRKDVRPAHEIDAISEYVKELHRSVKGLVALLVQLETRRLGTASVMEGDARRPDLSWRGWNQRVDAIITSPPYATALPYLDTDRLSLCYLKLLSRPKHRRRDAEMIGNREVTERQRREYWSAFQMGSQSLPLSVTRLIRRINDLNSRGSAGFRRRNLPSLLAKYFTDMRQVLQAALVCLRPGAPAYFVVGNNHTTANGELVKIDTPRLLADVAEAVGFEMGAHISMEVLTSRDIFRANAGDAETVLEFRAPARSPRPSRKAVSLSGYTSPRPARTALTLEE